MDNLQDAYLNVYNDIDEATAMAKRGYDEAPIRQQIAQNTGGGAAADRASALEKKSTFGDANKQKQRERYARAQRGDFRSTTSSNPGLHVGQHKSNDAAVQAKQAARGAQRGALTPKEKVQFNREDLNYNELLKFLYFEGYAESYAEAEELLESLSDEEFEDLLERKYDKDEKLPSGKTPSEKMYRKRGQHGARVKLGNPALGRNLRNDPERDSYINRAHTMDTVKKAQDAGEEPRDNPAWKNTIAARRRPTASYEVPNERPGGLRAKNTTAAKVDDQGRVRSHRAVTRKEEFESVIEYLFVEGYADTIEKAELMAENISENWAIEILEAAKDQTDKQIDKGVKTTYKAGNVLDNQHQGRSSGLNKLSPSERDAKSERMRGRIKARRDDLFGERNKREDAKREALKKMLGL